MLINYINEMDDQSGEFKFWQMASYGVHFYLRQLFSGIAEQKPRNKTHEIFSFFTLRFTNSPHFRCLQILKFIVCTVKRNINALRKYSGMHAGPILAKYNFSPLQ